LDGSVAGSNSAVEGGDVPGAGISAAAAIAAGAPDVSGGEPPLAVAATPGSRSEAAADTAPGTGTTTLLADDPLPEDGSAGAGTANDAISRGQCGVLTGRMVAHPASAAPSTRPSFGRW
jgi:hypothetical protein